LDIRGQEMKQKEIKNIIDKYIQAYNSFNVESMLSLMHPDIEFKNFSGENINMSTNGIKELQTVAIQAKTLFKSRNQTILKYNFIKDTASIEVDFEGILNRNIPNGPKAGEKLKMKGKSVFKFKDSKIVSLFDYS
jgi:hypothetical protein